MKYAFEVAKEEAKMLIKQFLPDVEGCRLQTLYPPPEIGADLSIPLFEYAKGRKQNPIQIAQEVARSVDISETLFLDVKGEKGYVNFYLNLKRFNKSVFDNYCNLKDEYGSSKIGEGKTIIVDYSSPNIAKPLSIGHLRSTIIGQSLYNIYKFLGYNVIGDNHIGDWGTQFGKLICAYKKWGNKESIEKSPIKDLLNLYVKFHKEMEKHADRKNKLEDEARQWFKKLEEHDEEADALWKWFKDLSWKEFEKVYDLLGIKFDYVLGESYYNTMLKEVVNEGLKKGVVEWAEARERYKEEVLEEEIKEKEKVALVWLTKYGINVPLLLQKSDGTSLYATRDLATAKYRQEKWNPEQIIYVVGGEQQLYFRQWFKVFELLGYEVKCVHVWFGLVHLAEGRMSTRKGRVIFLEDVLEESIKRAKNIIEERNLTKQEKDKTAKIVGIGAIKYADLSQDRIKDIVFDWDKMLNLEGNSAPYLQYAHTRALSILLKSDVDIASLENKDQGILFQAEEIDIIKRIAQFPQVVRQSAEDYKPHHIANYLFGLSQSFSRFYTNVPVLKAETYALKKTRLVLVQMIESVIKKGLNLLGIECPERM